MASITLYTGIGFSGKQVTLNDDIPSILDYWTDNQVSSAIIESGEWTLYAGTDYKGKSAILGPGRYDRSSLEAEICKGLISSLRLAKITLFQNPGFTGSALTITTSTPNLNNLNFSSKTSSVRVHHGVWVLYERENYKGRAGAYCPGEYDQETIRDRIGNNLVTGVKVI